METPTQDPSTTADKEANVHSAQQPQEQDSQRQPDEVHEAVKTIQKNYRGYRARRQMNGLGLDASTRWTDAIKEAQYRNLITPHKRDSAIAKLEASGDGTDSALSSPAFAHSEWRKIAQIAKRAGSDDTSESEGDENMSQEELAAYRKKKADAKKKREANSKMMGLEYFLELVDRKHRYGSHLRAYHAVWKQADTHENFFYWLDEGDGREVELESCSRARLERDQVRYLSREERQSYLVMIGDDGRLRWAKNGAPINTNNQYKDSMKGIVPIDDTTPAFREDTRHPHHGTDKIDSKEFDNGRSSTDPSSSASESDDSTKEGQHYVNRELESAKGMKKLKHISAGALFNHLLQSTTKKNTWIFVADTSFRLYIGIKQSGAFQHSSFLHGSRISAAGLIKVKNGQLRRLSPLSGHYRPPTSNFRAFVHTLREEGVDMSRVSISRSYAVLLGLEGYLKSKKTAKNGMVGLEHQMQKLFNPEEAKKREDASKDKSRSAQLEREYLEKEKKAGVKGRRTSTGFGSKLEAIFSRPQTSGAGTTTTDSTSKAGVPESRSKTEASLSETADQATAGAKS